MRLTKLVPAMGLLAAAAAPSMGVELANGTLSINGYVDVVASYTEYGKGTPQSLARTSSAPSTLSAETIENNNLDMTLPSEQQIIMNLLDGWSESSLRSLGVLAGPQAQKEFKDLDISAMANLEVSWRVGEDVEAVIAIDAFDNGDLELDEAYITWAFADDWGLAAGKYTNWLGWESPDAPDMYTVNNSLVSNLTGVQVIGGSIGWQILDEEDQSFELALHAVESIYGLTTRSTELAYALAGGYSNDAFGSIGFSINFEPTVQTYNNASLFGDLSSETAGTLGLPTGIGGWSFESLLGGPQKRDNVFGVNVFAEVDVVDNWLFALDLHYVNIDARTGNPGADTLGVMAMANMGLPTPFPSSLTAMVSYLDVDVEPGNGMDDQWLQVQLAWLTNPTGSDNFGLNFELRYLNRDDSAPLNKNRDEIAFYVELLAVLP